MFCYCFSRRFKTFQSEYDNSNVTEAVHFTDYYAPNFETVGSILLSACPCIRPSVRPSIRPFKKIKARVLKFHIWISRQK